MLRRNLSVDCRDWNGMCSKARTFAMHGKPSSGGRERMLRNNEWVMGLYPFVLCPACLCCSNPRWVPAITKFEDRVNLDLKDKQFDPPWCIYHTLGFSQLLYLCMYLDPRAVVDCSMYYCVVTYLTHLVSNCRPCWLEGAAAFKLLAFPEAWACRVARAAYWAPEGR